MQKTNWTKLESANKAKVSSSFETRENEDFNLKDENTFRLTDNHQKRVEIIVVTETFGHYINKMQIVNTMDTYGKL